jgi:feruloyl esterase
LLLVRNAVLKACDTLDGLADGILDNLPACTKSRVEPQLAQLQCTGAKTDSCLTADQISTLENAFDGAVNSRGEQLYSDWPWDAGIGGRSGAAFSQSWRTGWLGSYTATTNTASKLGAVLPLAVIYSTPPTLPISTADIMRYALNYNFDTDPNKIYATSSLYALSGAQLYFAEKTDLSAFKNHGGKLMMYHGGSDSTVSLNDTLRWYNAMNVRMGTSAQDFARLYIVPGMGHCGGGPATDSFDMLPQLVDWVENGVPPDSVPAAANVPGYFGVAARTRPLCPYPKQARYLGTGDINDLGSFTCK